MPKTRYRALERVDPAAVAAFAQGVRRRTTDAQILRELQACADRLGRSPTMRELAADPEAGIHPQTAIEHFGSWNAAKRAAGLLPRRFLTRAELLAELRRLGEELGRAPSAQDLKDRRPATPSVSLYWHTFGSFTAALREAGFDVPVGDERLERAIGQGAALARRLGRLPKFADWAAARREDETLLTEWQVYRMLEGRRGAWATFQYLVRERLLEEGAAVDAGGAVTG
jgi:hypothetical protein